MIRCRAEENKEENKEEDKGMEVEQEQEQEEQEEQEQLFTPAEYYIDRMKLIELDMLVYYQLLVNCL